MAKTPEKIGVISVKIGDFSDIQAGNRRLYFYGSASRLGVVSQLVTSKHSNIQGR